MREQESLGTNERREKRNIRCFFKENTFHVVFLNFIQKIKLDTESTVRRLRASKVTCFNHVSFPTSAAGASARRRRTCA